MRAGLGEPGNLPAAVGADRRGSVSPLTESQDDHHDEHAGENHREDASQYEPDRDCGGHVGQPTAACRGRSESVAAGGRKLDRRSLLYPPPEGQSSLEKVTLALIEAKGRDLEITFQELVETEPH